MVNCSSDLKKIANSWPSALSFKSFFLTKSHNFRNKIPVVKILFKCNHIKVWATMCYLKVEEASKMATLMTKEMLDRRWNFNNQANPAMLDCHLI